MLQIYHGYSMDERRILVFGSKVEMCNMLNIKIDAEFFLYTYNSRL